MKIDNASSFHQTQPAPGLILYSSHQPVGLADFQTALNPVTWNSTYDPFAHALVDEKTQETVLIRDHLGIAPLYYSLEAPGRLIFGDNLPDLIRALGKKPGFLESQVQGLFSESHPYSDETFYQGIYRVEPGHLLHIQPDGRIQKKAFWKLEKEGETLRYEDDRDYVAHFTDLLKEATRWATKGKSNLAAEFSAGIDSTSVFLAAKAQGLSPKLYMHGALPGSPSQGIYNTAPEEKFLELFPEADLTRVIADGFDPISEFTECAKWFAGPAPYIYFLFVHPLYRAIAAGKHGTVLSGFGGDQGVSTIAPLQFFLPTLLNQKDYRKAWQTLPGRNPVRKIWKLAKHSNGQLYEVVQSLTSKAMEWRGRAPLHPFHKTYFRTLREAEWSFLQGPLSHEVRMRIEYSSVMSRKFGFEYRYPLLFPKLLEFFLSVPPEQKRHDGQGRYLIRRYMAQYLPTEIFDSYQKRTGLGIIPGTFEFFKKRYSEGAYGTEFQDLPYSQMLKRRHLGDPRIALKAFLLKSACP